ncbi:flagellar hook-length control protein FliK [Thalassotalea sediminis]|uniref:flagellar hook-length control protein FliK n=1 Tax=Thalassotalea sediminis TaxID=1759089 RepID=UPI0025743AB8|nr:flagellar hook-length control protein FliK [Thalassotalea sediminis]
MTQMNVLPVEVNQGSENKGLLSHIGSNKDSGVDRQTSSFAGYMNENQAKNNGKKRQDHDRDTVESRKNNDVSTKQSDQKADIDKTVEQKTKEDADASTQAAQSKDSNEPVKESSSAEDEAITKNQAQQSEHSQPGETKKASKFVDAEVHNTRAEVAIKLLDFINASEVVSTEHSNVHKKAMQEALEAAKQINAQQQLEQSGKKPSETVELAHKEQKLAAEIQAILSGRNNKNTSNEQKQNEVNVDGQIKAIQSEDADKKNTDKLLKALAGENQQSDKSTTGVSDAQLSAETQAQKVANTIDKESQKAVLKGETAQQVNEQLSVVKEAKTINADTEVDLSVKGKSENVQVNTSTSVELDEAKSEEQHIVKDAKVIVNPVASDSPQKADSKDGNTRVINQATSTVVNNTGGATEKQADNSEQQQFNDNASAFDKSQSEQKSSLAVENDKKAVADTKVERHVNFAEPTQSTTALSKEEEQAAHAMLAKANADSISVQSTRTAQVIAQETIAINRKDFSVAVKEKVMVMINQKLRQLEIRLDPPELGSMQVKINMQNEQAAVNFVVQNPQAKDALEQHMGKLKDMLEQSGVDVGDANIEQREPQSDGDTELNGGSSQSGSNEDNGLMHDESIPPEANLYKASSTGVDYYA